MKTVELLKAGRALIADPKNWTKGAYARDSNEVSPEGARYGIHVNAAQPSAVCWCSAGALKHFTQSWDEDYGPSPIRHMERMECYAYKCLLNTVKENTPYCSVESFNDSEHTTHAKVLEIWDLAIARAERLGI